MSEKLTYSSTNSLRIAYIKSCFRPTYRVKWLKNKGAILIIIWSYLVTNVFHLLRNGYDPQQKEGIRASGIITIVTIFIFCPIGGWLADTCIGRYRAIHYSMWMMWIALILGTFSELLAEWSSSTWYEHLRYPVLCILALVAVIGFCGFQSNIMQLGITQLSNASTIEITSFITWYAVSLYISQVTFQFATNCIIPTTHDDDGQYLYIKTFVVALSLTVALVLDFLFRACLAEEPTTGQSLSLIFKVIKFSIKHRHSFIAEGDMPSRFNIAKRIYGGPFTSQQVEDVKSILRIIILIAICSVVCAALIPVGYATHKIEYDLVKWSKPNGLTGCYERMSVYNSDYIFTIGIVVLYEFVIYPLFHKCLPRLRIASQILLGILLYLLRILALLGIEMAAHTQHLTPKCVFTQDYQAGINTFYKWLLIPNFTSGLSSFLFILSAIEFIWAQTPYFMTGLAFGIMCSFLALYTFIHLALASPFLFIVRVPWEHYPLTCGFWYFLMQAVVVLIAFVVGLIAFKKYKERTRHNSPELSSNFYEDSAISHRPFC